jgi:hypothetical protein
MTRLNHLLISLFSSASLFVGSLGGFAEVPSVSQLSDVGSVSHLLNQVIDKNGKPIPAFFIAYAWYFLPNKCETLPTDSHTC